MKKSEEKKAIIELAEKLGVSVDEATEVFKFDNDEVDNEEVDKIEEKAGKSIEPAVKSTKKAGSPLDKVKHAKAKKKVDETKDVILSAVKTFMETNSEIFVNVQNLTTSKFTFKDKDGAYCSITFTKHKAKPDGYTD